MFANEYNSLGTGKGVAGVTIFGIPGAYVTTFLQQLRLFDWLE